MNPDQHQRRIERWLKLAVALIVPITIAIGVWLLLTSRDPESLPRTPATANRVYGFPAEPGPPSVTLTPSPAPVTPPTPASSQ
jgi:hypothetical protein